MYMKTNGSSSPVPSRGKLTDRFGMVSMSGGSTPCRVGGWSLQKPAGRTAVKRSDGVVFLGDWVGHHIEGYLNGSTYKFLIRCSFVRTGC